MMDPAARPAPDGEHDDRPDPAVFAPPAAPMAMPKQVLERAPRTSARGLARGLRLPLFGGRVQGQP